MVTLRELREQWRSWLRHCITNRKVAGSIHDGVTGNFHWHNSSGRTMALASTQPLTEMSTSNTSWWVKATSAYGWQLHHPHVPIFLKSGSPRLLEPSGPFQDCACVYLPYLKLIFRPFPEVSHIPLSSRFIFCSLFRHSCSFHPLYVTYTYVYFIINFNSTYLLRRGFVLSLLCFLLHF